MRQREKTIFGLLMVAVLGIGIVSVSAMAANTNVTGVHDTADIESDESAQLAHLAKITLEDAKAIAVKKVGGEVNEAELGNEDGNLVYSVEITKDKTTFDVKVDAGNGKILGVDSGLDDGAESESDNADTDNIEHEFEGTEDTEGIQGADSVEN